MKRVRLISMIVSGILLVILSLYYLSLQNVWIFDAPDNEATVQYSVQSTFLPMTETNYQWKAEGIAGIYLNGNGVIGADTRVKPAIGCEYPLTLEVQLVDGNIIKYDFKSKVFLFDPIFVSLVLLLLIQIKQTILPVKRFHSQNQPTVTRAYIYMFIQQYIFIFITVLLLLSVIEPMYHAYQCLGSA